MKRLRIDFLPASRPPRWAWWLCCALAATALALAAASAWQWRALDRLERERAAIELQWSRRGEQPAAPVAAPPRPYDADARVVMRQAAFPAVAALAALESTAIVGVTPVMVELGADTGLARVQVEYTDQASLMNFLSALNAGESAPRWVLVQARNANAQAKGAASFQAQW